MHFYYGLSSLLYIVPFIKSLYVSNSILWKISTGCLVISSFLYNSTYNTELHDDYTSVYLLSDLFTIYVIGLTYINNAVISTVFMSIFATIIKNGKDFDILKNITMFLTVLKIMYNLFDKTTLFSDFNSTFLLAITCYKLRHIQSIYNSIFYNTLITILWHLLTAKILYIISSTI